MKAIPLMALLLSCAGTHAQVYTCPQFYPDKDKPAAPLTGAMMRQTEPTPTNYLLDDEAAEEGYDAHYGFDPGDQTWLVCFYGGTDRIKGRFHDGHEWNQRIASAASDWEMQLPRKVRSCTVQVRERKTRESGKSTWAATATCE
jgi:hypothetical protein